MDYKKTLQELYSRPEWKFKLGLSNMRILLKKLGNPERKLRCIHIAGTNGKGSVCAMVSSVLTEAGYKIGMYTSPHLKKFNERIRINNKFISDRDVAKYYLEVKNYVTNQSFFEITTAMAFLYFLDRKVDYAVIEVGMGGRLDSTNLITPLISVITNIGYEHEKFLGDTIEKIAYEKAGIIKNGIPVVAGAKGTALKTIRNIANERNSELHAAKKTNKKMKLGLKGGFQQQNAAIAAKALEILADKKIIKINNKNVENGLKKARWPARFQFVSKNVLIDSAHNPDGFKVLFNELKKLDYERLVLVAGFSMDKNIKKASSIINSNKKIKEIILAQADNERAMKAEDTGKYFKNAVIIKNSKKALDYAKKIAGKNDLILVCGSIYLIGEVIKQPYLS